MNMYGPYHNERMDGLNMSVGEEIFVRNCIHVFSMCISYDYCFVSLELYFSAAALRSRATGTAVGVSHAGSSQAWMWWWADCFYHTGTSAIFIKAVVSEGMRHHRWQKNGTVPSAQKT